ncbi:MAG: hypothetical protein ABIA63_03430, partial [bacterium]
MALSTNASVGLGFLGFDDHTERISLKWVGPGLVESSENILRKTEVFFICPSSQINAIKANVLNSEDTAARVVGNKLNLDYLVTGRYSLNKNLLFFDGELISVKESDSVKKFNIQAEPTNFLSLQSQLIDYIIILTGIKSLPEIDRFLSKPRTYSNDSYGSYAMGSYYLSRNDLIKAAFSFKRAYEIDNSFSDAVF